MVPPLPEHSLMPPAPISLLRTSAISSRRPSALASSASVVQWSPSPSGLSASMSTKSHARRRMAASVAALPVLSLFGTPPSSASGLSVMKQWALAAHGRISLVSLAGASKAPDSTRLAPSVGEKTTRTSCASAPTPSRRTNRSARLTSSPAAIPSPARSTGGLVVMSGLHQTGLGLDQTRGPRMPNGSNRPPFNSAASREQGFHVAHPHEVLASGLEAPQSTRGDPVP